MTFGDIDKAKQLARENFHRKNNLKILGVKGMMELDAMYEALFDAVSIGSAIASGHDVELTDDGVRVIVREDTK